MKISLLSRNRALRDSFGVLTSYHKVPFCAAEQLGVDQPLDLCLGEGGLEV